MTNNKKLAGRNDNKIISVILVYSKTMRKSFYQLPLHIPFNPSRKEKFLLFIILLFWKTVRTSGNKQSIYFESFRSSGNSQSERLDTFRPSGNPQSECLDTFRLFGNPQSKCLDTFRLPGNLQSKCRDIFRTVGHY